MDDKRYTPGSEECKRPDLLAFLIVVAAITLTWVGAGFFSSPEGAQVIRMFFR